MSQRSISRRGVLAAGVTATAAAAAATNLGPAGLAFAADEPPGPDPRALTENVGQLVRTQALVAPVAGEDVRFYAAGSLNPNGTVAGTTLLFPGTPGRGVRPVNSAASTNYASVSVDVPVGSTLTGIEFVIEGTPQAGRITFLKWTVDTTGSFSQLFSFTIPAATTNGVTVYTGPLNELVDGSHTYEAFYTDNGNGVALTSGNGIRVRFRPPGSALVPIPPVRVYDSRLNMSPDANGVLSNGANRSVSVASSRNPTTGAIITAVVPANATAIAYTLTVADTVGQGFLAVNPGGTTAISASTINWSAPGSLLANTGAVQLGPNRTVTVVCGGGGAANFIIDVVGYYL